jgi:hypothetical protein
VVNGGYVDNGSFLNFGGPNLNMTFSNSKILPGMFPPYGSKKTKELQKTPLLHPVWALVFPTCLKAWYFKCHFTTIPKRQKKMADGI